MIVCNQTRPLRVRSCAAEGRPGASAYELAVRNGFDGTEAEWLASLKGDAGAPGENAVIWYTTAGVINYRVMKGALVGPQGAEPAAGQLIICRYDGYLYFIAETEEQYVVVDWDRRMPLLVPLN